MEGRKIKLYAFLVASQLDIKGIKTFLEIKPLADSSSELFYAFSHDKFQYFFNYGVIVFAGYTDDEMRWAIKTVDPFLRSPAAQWMRDEYMIHLEEGSETIFDFNELLLARLDAKVYRIAMLNLAQSVALDSYHSIAESLLTEVKLFANQLEKTGAIKVRRKDMVKFVGRALNTQNEIAENIYIFDAPEIVWDDAYLDGLHQGLIKHFDLRVRFNEIEYTLKIIQNNLAVFMEIRNQRESSILEWIIIVLILVEVFDLLITKMLLLF